MTVIAGALVICCTTDLLSYRVPNAVTLPAIAFCLGWSLAFGEPAPGSAITAGVAGGGFLLTASLVTRGGLGAGDVKLGVLAGAALGIPVALFVLGAGVVVGSLAVIALNVGGVLERQQGIPFAPFLTLPAMAALLLL